MMGDQLLGRRSGLDWENCLGVLHGIIVWESLYWENGGSVAGKAVWALLGELFGRIVWDNCLGESLLGEWGISCWEGRVGSIGGIVWDYCMG